MQIHGINPVIIIFYFVFIVGLGCWTGLRKKKTEQADDTQSRSRAKKANWYGSPHWSRFEKKAGPASATTKCLAPFWPRR